MNNEQYINSDTMKKYPKEIHPSVKLGKNVTIGMNCILEEGVVIGDNCFIGHHVLIRPNSKIGREVGIRSFCLIDPEVEIDDNSQIYPHATLGGGTKVGKNIYFGPYTLTTNSSEPGVITPPVIEDNVIVYAGCMIGPGVTIGKGAIVGMGSTITKSIAPMEVWYGDSAKYRRKTVKKDYGIEEDSPWPSVMLEYLDELSEKIKK
jgi:acetyltransferase-like isoleucine patch superfamily enzyme